MNQNSNYFMAINFILYFQNKYFNIFNSHFKTIYINLLLNNYLLYKNSS